MNEKKRELLNLLVSELENAEELEQTSLFTAEELGAPADAVRTLINEIGTELISVLGEFFFMPYEDEDVLYFATAITISEDIPADCRLDLEEAVARINSIIPCGGFATGTSGDRLIYRYTAPFLAKQDAEEQKVLMLTAVNAAMETVDRFVGYLTLAASGDMSSEEVMKLVVGRPEENPSADE